MFLMPPAFWSTIFGGATLFCALILMPCDCGTALYPYMMTPKSLLRSCWRLRDTGFVVILTAMSERPYKCADFEFLLTLLLLPTPMYAAPIFWCDYEACFFDLAAFFDSNVYARSPSRWLEATCCSSFGCAMDVSCVTGMTRAASECTL